MKSTASSFAIPPAIGAVLARLPGYPGSLALATALSFALAPRLAADVLAILSNRKLRIHVRDAQLTFDVCWNGRRFIPGQWRNRADLTIGASAHDFLRLAQRQQDPDTLFFDRRLSMEGDTELGLVLKNALDALELPVFDPQRWMPQAVAARVVASVRHRGVPVPGMWGRRPHE